MSGDNHYYVFILNALSEHPPEKEKPPASDGGVKILDVLCMLLFAVASFVVLLALVFLLGVWGVFVFPAVAALLAWLIFVVLYNSVRQDPDNWVIGFLIVLALLGLAGYEAAPEFGLRRFFPPAANAGPSTGALP